MVTVFLVEGPVGAGKSTFGLRLAEQRVAIRFCLDDWMRDLFRPDRPDMGVLAWYQERKQRCVDRILETTVEVVRKGRDVVLELGLVSRSSRRTFYDRMDLEELTTRVYVLSAPREVRLARVRRRNVEMGPTHHAYISDEWFELADALWEEPDVSETKARDIVYV